MLRQILKLIALAALWRAGESANLEREPLSARESLDFFMGFLLALVVAGWFGMYDKPEWASTGPRYIGDGIVFLVFWIIKFLVLAGVCMWLVSVLMSQIQGIGTKLAIYGGVAVVLLIAQVLSQQGEQRREREALAQAEANERRAEERKRQRELDAELAVEEAAEAEAAETAAAEARHQDVREALLARYEELSAVVPARWRDDVMAAGATGKPGEVPPMIRMTPVQRGMWQVTNLIDKPVCVRITRVIEEGGRRQRCPLDAETQCREIGRKASRRILLYENPSVPACAHGQLEFRVGTAASPEPSWWTRTALEDFDPAAVVDDLRYRKYSIDHLRGEIALFEAMLADRQRATRWRNEWGGPEG